MAKLMEMVTEHLQGGERVDAVVEGQYVRGDTLRTGILLATDRRLVFFRKKITGHELESYPWGQVSSFEAGKNMMGHWYKLFASGNQLEMKWIKGDDAARRFAELVRSRVGQRTEATAAAAPVAEDPGAALERLRDLLRRGLISQAEHDAKRVEILARM